MFTAAVPSASSPAACSVPSLMRSGAFYGGQQRLFSIAARCPRMAPAISVPAFPVVEAKASTSRENRTARHKRIRKKRPRMSVFRSNKHIYVQVVDDTRMHTLAAASTMQKSVSEEVNYSSGPTIEVARKIGEVIAKACLEKGITKVAFDRGGYPYHGRIEALATAAREGGLQF
ncbi:unnamed protein product [Spirodela intermedia]|uniref:Large ribosomal subunit protein uL18c n=1 Tax=Spirodela intermedia TaxID=51605 RepID=A0A7I8JC62_SPIIN|nr:unnamed protein product [Spirodela intermedia]CAA6667315.1 unnamed protein product [Spirodela intermedia]